MNDLKRTVFPKRFLNLLTVLLLLLLFQLGPGNLSAQPITYGTGHWDRSRLGNHRAVIQVFSSDKAVGVHIPWRREDNPTGKKVILIDSSTGTIIKNFTFQAISAAYADLVFQPVSGKGIYYLYYMPFNSTGSTYFPNTVYPAQNELDSLSASWENLMKQNPLKGKGILQKRGAARTLRLDAINEFNQFYPMELVANQNEVDKLRTDNPGKDFLIFPEDSKHAIRMKDHIPLRWAKKGDDPAFSAVALKKQFFVFQIGVFAAFKPLNHLELRFHDLKAAGGSIIPATRLRCFNLGGTNWLGQPFTKTLTLSKDEVQALWVGLDLPRQLPAGRYEGVMEVTADDAQTRQIKLSIQLKDSVLEDRGYCNLSSMARLNWLDSKIGLDDSVFKPYKPMQIKGKTISVLGRTLRFNHYGLPEQITSYFTGSNDRTNGAAKKILHAPVQFMVIQGGKKMTWQGADPVVTSKSPGAISWTGTYTDPLTKAKLQIAAKMECDGYINYFVTLQATKDLALDDLQLQIPYRHSASRYMMGLGAKGGFCQSRLDWNWSWDSTRANNMIWIGDVNAGLQCKLKNQSPDWSLYNFNKTGPYKDWSNNGKGGCSVSRQAPDSTVLVKAYTGARTLAKGQELHLNFALLITPVKPLDNHHFTERYFQADPPINHWQSAALEKGANIMNIHQGNSLNPYINYPFLTVPALKKYIAENRRNGIRTKLYYTVRELSNHAAEIWALRSLGDEVFTPGLGAQLANQFEDDGLGGNLHATGGSWIVEHLRTKYDAAWHTPLPDGENDMAIRTEGLSRWHNYYLEGLSWLIKNTGARGIYLDGVGYDREIMKRVRKVMDRAADSCLIDFHSGNNFSPSYGMNSPINQYMELLPCINSLWLGEGYNYDESPAYYLTEIAGIPFGLYSEMLNGCGNAYRGMIYGMTSRLGWLGCDPSALWKLWDYFGIEKSEMIGYWDPDVPVTSSQQDVKVTVYQKKDKMLIAYASWAKKDVQLGLKLQGQHMDMHSKNIRIFAPDVPGLQSFHSYNAIKALQSITVSPGKGGFIIIEKSNEKARQGKNNKQAIKDKTKKQKGHAPAMDAPRFRGYTAFCRFMDGYESL
ncbi:DUF6067 family protein [Arachidicoccus ginsenosidivorans]|uniref:Glycoside hydrolase 123-like N-terminal domain-containing protein n=1 Tax=Arachidicoccus ginsenosidivorans TaxID=496057 RepID=A0A5B8VRU1_9BACT|nr:glycoside hydrolase domain-containing protein [Arachidicoccus ginsenosidivorans]QEC73821.1 hypothetical protein FSB73_21300 [Arachidicoccus ginsenosidivorans]